MEQLIIFFKTRKGQLINARELHDFLEIQTEFTDWIRMRIEKYRFRESIDYVTSSKNLKEGGSIIEYSLTSRMAKEICINEKTDKGKLAKRFYSQMGKQAIRKQLSFLTKKELAQMGIDEEDEIEKEKSIISLKLKSQIPF